MADPIVDPVLDNQALNQMVAQLEDLNAELSQQYDRIKGDAAPVTITYPNAYLRGAQSGAAKTRVTNFGPNAVIAKENGAIVGICAANASLDLPLTGQGSINFSLASTGQSAAIAVATYIND